MTEAFRGECLSLAAQLEHYAKIDGMLPGVVSAMQESAAALRLAAKPDEDGVREATIEECAKIADAVAEGAATPNGQSRAELIAGRIRALSTTGKPKP